MTLSDLIESLTSVLNTVEFVEGVSDDHREYDRDEHAECCATKGDAHEHGREMGWYDAMDHIKRLLDGENP